MLGHCKGHPLAIVVLGGVLATKKTLEEWQYVYDNLQSYLQGDGLYSGVYEVLALSYYDLSYHLKACFLILGYFPEDFEIPAQRVYHLWIAEGIVSSTEDQGRRKGKRSLEEIAKVYLNELVQRGLVQVMSRDLYGDIEKCKLHDLMRDKCIELADQDNFLQIVDRFADVQQQSPPASSSGFKDTVRRLAIYVGPKGVKPSLPNSSIASRVRSLLFFVGDKVQIEDCGWMDDVSKNFQLLRILDFTGLERLEGKVPSSIGSLIYLRYLSIRGTRIDELPSEIGNLRSLLILDLQVSCRVRELKLPNELGKIQSLRQLYLPQSRVSSLTLGNMRNLEIIEGLDLDRVLDVEDLQQLTCLQRLHAYSEHKKEASKEALSRVLKSSSIKRMFLQIPASMFVGLSDILAGCHFLESLDIIAEDCNRIDYPISCEKLIPKNLKCLWISNCGISEDWISAIEKLPRLKQLQFFLCDLGSKMHISSEGFPELTNLWIRYSKLTEWTVEKGGLPKLTELVIEECRIKMLPQHLPQQVSIECRPCVPGIERYGSCPKFAKRSRLSQPIH